MIKCGLSFQVFHGSEPGYSIFKVRMCQYGDPNSSSTVAGLAQSVERLTAEREVAGSIPGPDHYSGS